MKNMSEQVMDRSKILNLTMYAIGTRSTDTINKLLVYRMSINNPHHIDLFGLFILLLLVRL